MRPPFVFDHASLLGDGATVAEFDGLAFDELEVNKLAFDGLEFGNVGILLILTVLSTALWFVDLFTGTTVLVFTIVLFGLNGLATSFTSFTPFTPFITTVSKFGLVRFRVAGNWSLFDVLLVISGNSLYFTGGRGL